MSPAMPKPALDQAQFYPVMQASFLGNEQPLMDLILKIIV